MWRKFGSPEASNKNRLQPKVSTNFTNLWAKFPLSVVDEDSGSLDTLGLCECERAKSESQDGRCDKWPDGRVYFTAGNRPRFEFDDAS